MSEKKTGEERNIKKTQGNTKGYERRIRKWRKVRKRGKEKWKMGKRNDGN